MYFTEPADRAPLAAPADLRWVISGNCVALIALGFFPGVLLDLCARVL
jgi:NADH-quinone oxidoreductase subunit N